ncbi:MAG: hypothetical protein ABSE73_07445 [Planctomycetota bacterium]
MDQQLRVCSKVLELLREKQIAPLGLAGTVEEVRDVLVQLKKNRLSPGIFVINTFGAKDILPGLNPLMGEVPALFLRRQLFAGKSGLADIIKADASKSATTMIAQGRGTPRLTAVWPYGSKNSYETAKYAAGVLFRFLQDGDFTGIASAAKAAQIQAKGGS